jgi:hypothetical protein
MLVSIDDIVIPGSTPAANDRWLHLSETFPIKDTGTLQYFLGLKASYNSVGMILTSMEVCTGSSSLYEFGEL